METSRLLWVVSQRSSISCSSISTSSSFSDQFHIIQIHSASSTHLNSSSLSSSPWLADITKHTPIPMGLEMLVQQLSKSSKMKASKER